MKWIATINLLVISTGHATPWLDLCNSARFYQMDWNKGIDSRLHIEAATPSDITTVPLPHGYTARKDLSHEVLKVTIYQNQNFDGVANGTPRAEVSFSPVFRFENGNSYEIRWSTLLPDDYVFDTQQPEIITQLHQGVKGGSPPFSLSLADQHYHVALWGGPGTSMQSYSFGNAANDRGRRISWKLRYRPDDDRRYAITELFRNNRRVVYSKHVPNAYPNDSGAYFKIGIYKWWWKTRPSDVNERTIYYGNVEIRSALSCWRDRSAESSK